MSEKTQVKRLDYKQRSFVANGHEYTILESIPLGRYIKYQKLWPRVAYGLTFPEVFGKLKQAYELQNTGRKYADVAVILHNLMNTIKGIEDDARQDPAMLLCALFIVRDGEDLTNVDEEYFREKINDWAKEGYEINGFFHLALLSIENFRETFEQYIQKTEETKGSEN